jgi:hypothetical protein
MRTREKRGWQAKAPAPHVSKVLSSNLVQLLSPANSVIVAIFSRTLWETVPLAIFVLLDRIRNGPRTPTASCAPIRRRHLSVQRVILVLANWLLGLEDFEQLPAFDFGTLVDLSHILPLSPFRKGFLARSRPIVVFGP